jgi:hypothetical protein
MVLFGVLFGVAWWLEDCLIYSVNWDQFYTFRLGLDVLGILGSGIHSAGHLVWVGIARGSSLMAQDIDELPSEVREPWPMARRGVDRGQYSCELRG